ncbi:hypothetical protein KY363_04940 [Candidatus Woesearchaeota archaeon]|nr:hypothetical protein [Candidatus Woesearchaeota archaeon]
MPAPLDYVPAVYPSHPSLVRLLDGNPEYVPDVCDKLFSDKGGMDQEELLLRFFELFRSEDEAAMFGLVRENLPPTDGKMGLPDYLAHVCFAYQMPFVDVAVLFGSYVLYCAEQKGLVSSTQKGVDQPLVEYRLGEMPQRLESRL